jgi:hypothetical protein
MTSFKRVVLIFVFLSGSFVVQAKRSGLINILFFILIESLECDRHEHFTRCSRRGSLVLTIIGFNTIFSIFFFRHSFLSKEKNT